MGSIMQQWVGVNAVNSFAPQIFESAGSSSDQAHVFTVYIGVAKLVFVLVALALMDRVGRKPLLLVGCAGMALSCAGLAASFGMEGGAAKGNTAVACLVLYMAFFEISLGPILWLLLSELYPVEVKGVAMSVGATMCWCVARARAERRASFFQRVVSAVSSLPLSSSPNFAGS
jgi:MFS family permease